MHIVVDYRERSTRVYALLSVDPTVRVSVRTLRAGDYLLDDQVLVERKTLTDFERSVIDARLFHQASRLSRAPQAAALIVEGTASDRRRGLGRAQLQGALLSLSLVFKIPVLRARDPEETTLQGASVQLVSADGDRDSDQCRTLYTMLDEDTVLEPKDP